MLLDALTNTYLGLRARKYGDKAEHIKKINFLLLVRRAVISAILYDFQILYHYFSFFQEGFLTINTKIEI